MSNIGYHEVSSELFLGGLDAEECVDRLLKLPEDGVKCEGGNDISVEKSFIPEVPDMWSWATIGLYSHFASAGLISGTTGSVVTFCVYS
jgi:hypothetical protein